MLKLQNVYDIYNYADDNTGGVSGKSAQEVCLKLRNLAQDNYVTAWFTENFMEANPSKFKFMVFSKTSHIYDIKIIGVEVDSRPSFNMLLGYARRLGDI